MVQIAANTSGYADDSWGLSEPRSGQDVTMARSHAALTLPRRVTARCAHFAGAAEAGGTFVPVGLRGTNGVQGLAARIMR